MDIPILDITNLPNKQRHICGTIGNNEHIGRLAINHIFSVNKKIHDSPTFGEIIFVSKNCDNEDIKGLYEKYYGDGYTHKTYDKLVYFVMQRDAPMQLYIPETAYTFVGEYKKLILLHDNLTKFYNKVIIFSQFYGTNSEFSKCINITFDEYKHLPYLYFVLDIMYALPKELNFEIMKIVYCLVDDNRVKLYNELLQAYHFI